MYFKGIVMSLKKKYAIVMIDSGEIIRLNIKEGLNIGDSILFLKEDIYNEELINNKCKSSKFIISLISVALITILFIIPVISNKINYRRNNVYAVLTIDINPSIEFKIDKNKKIVEVKGLNYDAIKLNIDDLIGLNIDEGTILLKEMILDNDKILNKDCILVGFTFLSDINDETFEGDVEDIIENNFEDFNIVYLNGTEEDLSNAKIKGISLGRYTISEEFKEKFSKEDIKVINIPELIELYKESLSKEEFCELEILDDINSELEDKFEKEEINNEAKEIDNNQLNEDYEDVDEKEDDIEKCEDDD